MFGSKQRKHERHLQEMANQANLEIHQMDNNFNERMAEKANQWNTEQWNREVAQQDLNWKRDAEYNSASAQVERYREAGLNPTIMMQGQGAGSATSQNVPHVSSSQASAGSPIPMQAAHQTFYTPKDVLEPMQNAFNSYVDNNMKLEQIQGMKLENQRKKQQMIYDLEKAKGEAKSASARANIDTVESEIISESKEFKVNTAKYNADYAYEQSKREEAARKYQVMVNEKVPEELAAKIASLKKQSKSEIQFIIDEYEQNYGTLEPWIKKTIYLTILGGQQLKSILPSISLPKI